MRPVSLSAAVICAMLSAWPAVADKIAPAQFSGELPLGATIAGFRHEFRTVGGVRLHFVTNDARTGAPVIVLLAGFPESWYAWRKVMPTLATAGFKVEAIDMPGQGDSDRPAAGYDTEALGEAIHGLLQALGIHRYFLAAHDVGAWVAYPYAARYPSEVERLALMDASIPGVTLPEAIDTSPNRAWRSWHFLFQQIPDLPEELLAGHERAYLTWFLRRKAADPASFTDADVDEYLRSFAGPGGIRAGLAFYRAVPLDVVQNRALAAKGKLAMPVLALDASEGSAPGIVDAMRPLAASVEGRVLEGCGHYVPEERPQVVAAALIRFFEGMRPQQ